MTIVLTLICRQHGTVVRLQGKKTTTTMKSMLASFLISLKACVCVCARACARALIHVCPWSPLRWWALQEQKPSYLFLFFPPTAPRTEAHIRCPVIVCRLSNSVTHSKSGTLGLLVQRAADLGRNLCPDQLAHPPSRPITHHVCSEACGDTVTASHHCVQTFLGYPPNKFRCHATT